MSAADLDIARRLAEAGIPLFVAPPANTKLGFALPEAWQQTIADPEVVDRWRDGWALCAVGGHGIDFVDIDPRHGGDESYRGLNGTAPESYGWVATPSSGFHSYVASMGVRSLNGAYPGLDIKAGDGVGEGRGFVFLPPTVRASKVDGEVRAYSWFAPLDLEGWAAKRERDNSGAALGEYIRRQHSAKMKVPAGGSDHWQRFLTQREPIALASALRTIEKQLTELAEFQPGGKDYRSMLRDVAYTVGGYVAGGALDRDVAHARLCEAVSAYYPVPNDDDLTWIAQGLDDGGDRPFPIYTPEHELADSARGGGGDGGGDGGDGGPPWNVYTVISTDPFDPFGGPDQDMAEQVIERMYPALRHAADASTWVVRDLERWREAKDAAGWAVSTVARLMPLGDPNLPKKKEDYLAEHHTAVRRTRFMTSGPAAGIERKLKSLVTVKGHPGALVLAELDADPEILWAGGLAYDLRASLTAPVVASVDPATPHLHTALCAPQDRETPLWDRFLAAVWPDEAERAWALRVLSVAFTGYADAALPVLWGEERNGKTSVVEFLLDVLGTYGVTADPKLLAGVDNAHGSIVYALKGTRVAFIDEGPRRGHLATERLKQLTGGGRLTGNAMYTNPITFKTTHTLIMTSNDAPPMTDQALRARIRAIHCTGDKAEVRARREALAPEAWRREAPGVLWKMITEAAAWLGNRSSALTANAPTSFRDTEEEVAKGQDPVREWVTDCTVPTEPGTPGRQLYRSFCTWYEGQAVYRRVSVPTETAFGRTLTDMGFPSKLVDGPTGRARYRSLSVFGGPAGWTPGPTGAATGVDRLPTSSGGQPVAPETACSDPLFSSSSTGTTGSSSSDEEGSSRYTQIGEERETRRGDREVNPYPSENGVPYDPPSAMNTSDGDSSVNPTAGHETVTLTGNTQTPVPPASSPPVVSGGLTQESALAARIADERKIAKVEARKLAKAELLAAAVIEAQGELRELPVAVDREGRLMSITLRFAQQLLSHLATLTVDVETTGYPIGHRDYRLKTVQLGNESVAVVLDPLTHAELISDALTRATTLHAHSASADLVPLAVAGLLDYDAGWAKMHDTVIPAKLGDPQSTGSDPGLKKLSAAVLGEEAVAPAADAGREALFKAGKWLTKVKPDHPVSKSGWAQVEPRSAVMLRYAASDVLDTAALATRLPPVPAQIAERERIAEEMTARVAYRGIKIDHERVRNLTAEHSTLQAQFGAAVRAYGIENPGSAQQVAVKLAEMGAVLPLTPGGAPSVAEHVLSVLSRSGGDSGVLARAVLDYRHSSTVLGLFLAPYALLCDLGDARARPTVYTMGADTGRMTCTRPNAQQLPRAGGIRSIYIADPGMTFISADFSGVELRGAAALSQDPSMLHMIAEEDAGRFDGFHWTVARQAYGPEASKSDRYNAKRGVFGTFYGGGAAGLSKQIGVTEQEMFAIIDSLKTIAPGYFTWSDRMRQAVRAGNTQYPSCSGRIIHLDPSTPHKAPAYAIQGSCRELLIDALIRWKETEWGYSTILPIHDELIAMVPIGDGERATAELVRCMEGELYGVRIKAEPSAPSEFWRDAE